MTSRRPTFMGSRVQGLKQGPKGPYETLVSQLPGKTT